MHDSTRFRLHFGPYRMPRFRYGRKIVCAVRGELVVRGISDAPIQWPLGAGPTGRKSLVVYAGLARAIRKESIVAVAHHWGVTGQTVTKWRRLLGIKGQPEGTSRLRRAHFAEPWADETRRKAVAKARDPVRRAKIAAARRGKRRPRHVIAALRKANLGRTLSAEHRAKMSAAHKARGTRPPWLNAAWEPWEDELLRTLDIWAAARETGRTLAAVKSRKRILPPEPNPPRRCPKCGCKIYPPCRACRAREFESAN